MQTAASPRETTPATSRGVLARSLAYAAHYRASAMFGLPSERDGWFRAWAGEMAKVRAERRFQTRTGSVAYRLPGA